MTSRIRQWFTFYLMYLTTLCTCIEHLNEVLQENTYDKRFMPPHPAGPLTITTQLFIASIGPINDKSNTFEVVYYHRQWWNDPRLAVNASLGPTTFSVPPSSIIWVPDVTITNSKSITSVGYNYRTVIEPSGDIYMSQKFRSSTVCELNFKDYPFDSQNCSMRLESFSNHKVGFDLKWHSVPIQKDKGVLGSLSGYELISIDTRREEVDYIVGYATETYPDLVVTFALKRSLMFYIFRSLIPVMLLMVLDLCSYWIPTNAIPARITLILTTILSSLFVLQTATEMTVKLPYANPMQLFLTAHIILIVISLVEYIIILNTGGPKTMALNYSNHQSEKTKNRDDIKSYASRINIKQATSITEKNKNENTIDPSIELASKEKMDVHPLDYVCRMALPIFYAIFCMSFWIYYLVVNK